MAPLRADQLAGALDDMYQAIQVYLTRPTNAALLVKLESCSPLFRRRSTIASTAYVFSAGPSLAPWVESEVTSAPCFSSRPLLSSPCAWMSSFSDVAALDARAASVAFAEDSPID
ncbi:hypothetical protein AG1IA_08182 [Rhizoctonia solani AG-1 IA]|uniref:Uncharacterized protein n=1 Tax=Thanatephorus cucumeris (strain AG1-IA) TaxID=983506 RepID=L8WN74_THACA|nr:hypothetical protein AG1IA_08182 [Rhizoctonia solani AG-1 IA]